MQIACVHVLDEFIALQLADMVPDGGEGSGMVVQRESKGCPEGGPDSGCGRAMFRNCHFALEQFRACFGVGCMEFPGARMHLPLPLPLPLLVAAVAFIKPTDSGDSSISCSCSTRNKASGSNTATARATSVARTTAIAKLSSQCVARDGLGIYFSLFFVAYFCHFNQRQ